MTDAAETDDGAGPGGNGANDAAGPVGNGAADHIAGNRERWNATADEYQSRNAPQITEQMRTGDLAWGLWGIPESQLHVLGDVAGKDVLELGCGAAQWSIALARRGARAISILARWVSTSPTSSSRMRAASARRWVCACRWCTRARNRSRSPTGPST